MRLYAVLSVLVSLTCFVQGGLVIPVGNLNPVATSLDRQNDEVSDQSQTVSTVDQIPVENNFKSERTLGTSLPAYSAALKASLTMMQNSVDKQIRDIQTQQIEDSIHLLKTTVGRFLKLAFRFCDALIHLATDKPIHRVKELGEQFEKAAEKLLTYMKKDETEFKLVLKENWGVPVGRDFETKWKKVRQELMNVIANGERVKAVLHIYIPDFDSQRESRASISQLVAIFASSVSKLKITVADMAATVDSIMTGLQTANNFLKQVIGTRNSTRATVRSTKADLRNTVLKERKSALDEYYVAQSSIRSELSSTIVKLTIFNRSKNLNRLSRKFDDRYFDLYHFLLQRNRTDSTAIGKSYNIIWKNMEDIYNQSVDIFFYAMRRTYLRLADVIFEGSFCNDHCYNTYSHSVPTKYQAINTLITDCTARERSRWMHIPTAIKKQIISLQSNSKELAMNIERCVTYTNFIKSRADYNQAKACLKTNLEDMHQLSFKLTPLFDGVVNLVKSQVAPSKFRLENCFVSKLHELTALLKSTRESMNECGGRFDSTPRPSYEDPESEFYDRHQTVKKPVRNCTKRPNVTNNNNENNKGERSSSEEIGVEKNKKKKDKNNKKDIGSGEQSSGEDDSDEQKDKKMKNKDVEKNFGNIDEFSSGESEDGDCESSEEVDGMGGEEEERGGHSGEEEDCCKSKDKDKNPPYGRSNGENSEEQFVREQVKGYSNNEEDIFKRKFGIVVPNASVDLAEPVASVADGIMKHLLENPANAEEETPVDITVKVVGNVGEPEQ